MDALERLACLPYSAWCVDDVLAVQAVLEELRQLREENERLSSENAQLRSRLNCSTFVIDSHDRKNGRSHGRSNGMDADGCNNGRGCQADKE